MLINSAKLPIKTNTLQLFYLQNNNRIIIRNSYFSLFCQVSETWAFLCFPLSIVEFRFLETGKCYLSKNENLRTLCFVEFKRLTKWSGVIFSSWAKTCKIWAFSWFLEFIPIEPLCKTKMVLQCEVLEKFPYFFSYISLKWVRSNISKIIEQLSTSSVQAPA